MCKRLCRDTVSNNIRVIAETLVDGGRVPESSVSESIKDTIVIQLIGNWRF